MKVKPFKGEPNEVQVRTLFVEGEWLITQYE